MTKRYKTKSKDEPYGLTRHGVPRKRPGRRKGSAKSPGTGRSKQPIELRLDLASDELALAVISGEPIHQYGTTGKAFTAPANLSLRQKFAEVWWNRRRPTLTATAVRADIVSEHVHREPAEPRELARAVLGILETARLADEPPIAEPTPSWPEPPETLLLTRDDIIEISASDRSGPSTPTAALPGEPRDGDRIDVDENGAHIRFHEATKKWQVLDNLNIPHAWKPTREKALEFARTLPKSSGVPQSDPYGPAEVGLYGDERRDNRATMPGKSKIVRRMPRRSR